jgi:hypothetical protein
MSTRTVALQLGQAHMHGYTAPVAAVISHIWVTPLDPICRLTRITFCYESEITGISEINKLIDLLGSKCMSYTPIYVFPWEVSY